ncbi:DNA mismatch repair protein MutS [Synechococcus sp. Nb3U1]|uniref:DNA mismatch repair protein MutS n=1 Tax=Synechococcus sp. Nb3U1 TaxID=1914529 RepID=UPI001F3C72F7|nr:DNA mismatch repair protein MutS [Synechococcus sp. Nb3U1]MCF2970359.1 DNA mismatch repair protein MutS [Synechococcus sp. Nb3U1]
MSSSSSPAPTWDALTVDPTLLTPMMQHYVELKRQYPHALLLYRLGDFYEMFFQDAYIVSRELELVLTGREGGALGRIPMCGVPHHAFERYAAQLVGKGYAIAVCEQMEPADQAKGLVRREVTRVITPGTLLEEELLKARQNNYLAAIVRLKNLKQPDPPWGLAYADISTGEFWVCQSTGLERLEQELARLQPAEILIPAEDGLGLTLIRPGDPQALLDLPSQYSYTLRPPEPFELTVARDHLLQTYRLRSLEGLGCAGLPLAVRAAGGLLQYLEETQKNLVQPSPEGIHPLLQPPRTYQLTDYLMLDPQTRRNLELTQTIREGAFAGSLLWVLDHSRTAMGGRALRRWLLQPLLDPDQIQTRQDTIQELLDNPSLRTRLGSLLDSLYDLERLASRVSSGTANPRELVALGSSLSQLPDLADLVAEAQTPLLQSLQQVDPALSDLGRLIGRTLLPSPPPILTEGGLIQPGVDPALDQLRQQVEQDRQWIANLEKIERDRTGIPTLKVGFNKAFGYYLSISRAKANQVPESYIRKQTLTNEERFITPDLKEKEARILTAQTDINQREYELFLQLRLQAGSEAESIRQIAQTIAAVDALLGLAEVAVQQGYSRPHITQDRRLYIEGGRHPVVEKSLPSGLFVANSVDLGSPEGTDLMVLTGPNMSGKSTYLRQIGLIQILAQMGSFIPAERAELGLCDRVFTRVGAVDDLATGQSTFMVEMNETANILNHASERSLVLLDEIGRGTATFDGLSIAWAVAEYLATQVRARTLFATHYHEMNQLETLLPNVANFQVVVKELGDHIIFLHQVQPGGADRSYGIEVGRMAGLPKPVIERAKQVLELVEKHSRIGLGLRNQGRDHPPKTKKPAQDGIPSGDQLSLPQLAASANTSMPLFPDLL